jgi:hypothetical protein
MGWWKIHLIHEILIIKVGSGSRSGFGSGSPALVPWVRTDPEFLPDLVQE